MMRDLLPSIARVVMLGNTPNRYIDLAMERAGGQRPGWISTP
jgi:hypothetical protein